jgi:CelD/BcsL family acetyltransferase involved in cellulose biosynthesis
MIEISPLPDGRILEQRWSNLAASSPHSFFLSWKWISTWLRCIPSTIKPELLTVSWHDRPVAVAILVKRTIWRHKLIPVRTWVLNATGSRRFDSICTEHNGLLAAAEHEHAAWDEVLDYFSTHEQDWDEFQLDGVPPWLADAWARRGMTVRQTRLDIGRFLDLDRVRASPSGSCIAILAPRLRTRLRHTLSAVERRFGPVAITAPATVREARSFFAELKELHIKRWRGKPHGDAFDIPFFERFHNNLIDCCFSDGYVQLVRVRAGPTTLGLLYNFVYQGRVSFYQSGINYAAAERGDSIGLLIHALLIDHNARQGHAIYDMLAGDAQYKRALAALTVPLWWGELQAERRKLRAAEVVTSSLQSVRAVLRGFLR